MGGYSLTLYTCLGSTGSCSVSVIFPSFYFLKGRHYLYFIPGGMGSCEYKTSDNQEVNDDSAGNVVQPALSQMNNQLILSIYLPITEKERKKSAIYTYTCAAPGKQRGFACSNWYAKEETLQLLAIVALAYIASRRCRRQTVKGRKYA